MNSALKNNFQSLAHCIEYLEFQFERGLTAEQFEKFRNHNPKYIPNIQWSELSFLNESRSDEYEQDVQESHGSSSGGELTPRNIPGLYDSDDSE